jgi:hypothetical protein
VSGSPRGRRRIPVALDVDRILARDRVSPCIPVLTSVAALVSFKARRKMIGLFTFATIGVTKVVGLAAAVSGSTVPGKGTLLYALYPAAAPGGV